MSLPSTVRQAVIELSRKSLEPVCAYVYDLPALEARIRAMRTVLPANCEIFYAAKANPEAPVLRTLAPWVDGFEAASGGELRWLYQHHPDKPLIFGGPGKLDSELAAAMEHNVAAFHVESLGELRRLAAQAKLHGRPAPIFLRLNAKLDEAPDSRLVMGGKPTPFGLDEAAMEEAFALLAVEPNLELQGLHFHLLSHQLDTQAHLKLMREYFRFFRKVSHRHGLQLPTLNVGGGMGIDYRNPERSFDWQAFCEGLAALIVEEAMGKVCIRFEIGRFIAASCGYYVMQVLDIKRNHGHHFAIGRGGTHHFRTPAAQGHDHPFEIVRSGGPAALENARVTLVGQLCTPKDVLAQDQAVAALGVGDLLVFSLAGAYAWNISHRDFLMHAPPEMVFLS